MRKYSRFLDFKMAAVRHLGFVICLDHPQEYLVIFVTVQNLVGIGAAVMQVLMF